MCKTIEEMIIKAQAESEYQTQIKIALNLLLLFTLSVEDIAKSTGLRFEDVQKLANSVTSST